jgi:hypothetical protein
MVEVPSRPQEVHERCWMHSIGRGCSTSAPRRWDGFCIRATWDVIGFFNPGIRLGQRATPEAAAALRTGVGA